MRRVYLEVACRVRTNLHAYVVYFFAKRTRLQAGGRAGFLLRKNGKANRPRGF
jgi:hypothetical protein